MEAKQTVPDWANRAEHIPHKPVWVNKIPRELHGLGDVFFPIPARRKGYPYPHHMDEHRFSATDETLNAHFEQGWGYGIACAGNLAVVDIDEREYVDEIKENLPDTVSQVTGSREGEHLFFICEGLNTREILHYPESEHDCDAEDQNCILDGDGECIKEYEWEHLGEIKCDPHGYVVGPGSVHPSGNKYGPLEGEEIAEIGKNELLKVLDGFIKPEGESSAKPPSDFFEGGVDIDDRYEFYGLTALDVLPWLETGKRLAHPVHGSTSGTNFMKNGDGQTFMCWRHNFGGSQGCALNAQQLLAQMEASDRGVGGYEDCERLRRRWNDTPELHYLGWRRAVDEGYIEVDELPFKVIAGYGLLNGIIEDPDEVEGEVYWSVVNALKYDLMQEQVPSPEPL